jgi:hypothetical protein
MTAGPFDDGWTNVMFVGRVIPNKKFEDVIRAFHVYRTRHNPRSRLLLVGSYGGFEKYLAMLHALVARLGTPDVHFLGHVSNEELTALYDVADLFLCASEHEGFLRAAHRELLQARPGLAYAATAVPATMDGGGVLYDTKDPFETARLMAALLDDADLEDAVIATQDAALDRLLARDFGGTLLRFVDNLRATAARPAPEVPYDFWAMFDQGRAARGAAAVPAGDLPGPADRSALCRSPVFDRRAPMRIHQWVPAAHRGDAIGDSARTVREHAARDGPRLGLFALTIDDDLRGDVLPFRRRSAPRAT